MRAQLLPALSARSANGPGCRHLDLPSGFSLHRSKVRKNPGIKSVIEETITTVVLRLKLHFLARETKEEQEVVGTEST